MTETKNCRFLLRALAAVLLLAAMVLGLFLGIQPVDQPKIVSASQDVAALYRSEMDAALSGILFGEVSVPRKEYKISDTALAAPVPDAACYGEATSIEELQWLLEKAEDILDGEKLYFSTNRELRPGSVIRYYLDDTILAITWKEMIDGVIFTFSEVKVRHPSQFRRYLSGGEFGSGQLSKTTEMSQSVNAVVACSADYYAYRHKGVVIANGTAYRANKAVGDLCFVDYDGNLILERGLELANVEEAQAYADEHNINFSLAFGPILVKDGENVCPKGYILGEVHEKYPRAAIMQMGDLHYMFGASNIEMKYYKSLTMVEFAASIYTTGCKQAYALDGGQTATVVMNNMLCNNVNYGSERLISDMIYFATAKPAGE